MVVVALELFGIGTLFYGLATVAEFFVSGQLSGLLEERRIQKMIDSYTDHFIICGFGRVGRQVARDLRAPGARYVVIDANPDNREAVRAGGRAVHRERRGRRRGPAGAPAIERAAGVIACVDSDAENIFIALTARELRADILIIARASAEESEKKLMRAGADRVISPYKTSGAEMARVALHPQVGGCGRGRRLPDGGDRGLARRARASGETVADVRGPSVIVALRRADGRLEPQPAPATVIDPGDKLVALGTPAALERLEGLFQPASVASRRDAAPLEELQRRGPRCGRRRARRRRRAAAAAAAARAAQARGPGRLLDERGDAARAGARGAAAGDRRADRDAAGGDARRRPRAVRGRGPGVPEPVPVRRLASARAARRARGGRPVRRRRRRILPSGS